MWPGLETHDVINTYVRAVLCVAHVYLLRACAYVHVGHLFHAGPLCLLDHVGQPCYVSQPHDSANLPSSMTTTLTNTSFGVIFSVFPAWWLTTFIWCGCHNSHCITWGAILITTPTSGMPLLSSVRKAQEPVWHTMHFKSLTWENPYIHTHAHIIASHIMYNGRHIRRHIHSYP